MKLTAFQRQVLRKARTSFLYGAAEVRAARALSKLGLVQLWDNGSMGMHRSDGERWSADLTPAGITLLDEEDAATRTQST